MCLPQAAHDVVGAGKRKVRRIPLQHRFRPFTNPRHTAIGIAQDGIWREVPGATLLDEYLHFAIDSRDSWVRSAYRSQWRLGHGCAIANQHDRQRREPLRHESDNLDSPDTK